MGAFHAGLIWLRVQDHPRAAELTLTDRAVLSVLFSFARNDEHPEAFPSASTIAERAGCSRRTVQRTLERLESLGVIVGEHQHRKPTIWTPCDTFQPGVTATPGGDTATPVMRRGVTQQATQRRSTGDTVTHQCSEGTYGAIAPNRSDPESGAYARSAPATRATAPPLPRRGLPPGLVPSITVTED